MMDAKIKAHEMAEQSAMRREIDKIRGQLIIMETAIRISREAITDLSDRLRALETRTLEA